MGLNISLGGNKKAPTTTGAKKTKVDLSVTEKPKATATKAAPKKTTASKTGVVKQGAKKPEVKVTPEGASVKATHDILMKRAPAILEHDAKVKEAAKDKAVHDNALKKEQSSVISELIGEGIADEASVEVKLDGKIVTVGAAGESTTLTSPVDAYNMLEEIEAGLGQELMTFSITNLKKHLTSKQLAQVTETKADPKKRRVSVKDDKK